MAFPPNPPPGSLPYGQPYKADLSSPAYRPPPSYAGPWAPPSPPRGVATKHAIQQIRDAIGYFWLTLVINFVLAIVSAATLGVAYNGGVGILSSNYGNTSSSAPLSGGALLAASAGIAVIALIGLIIEIYSYVKWRDGANDLKRWAGEFGAQVAQVAYGVREDLGRATKMFVVQIVAIIVLVVGIGVVVVGSLVSSGLANLNNTTATPTTVHLTSGQTAEIAAVVAGFTLILTVISVLLYAYATRSHVNTLAPFASEAVRTRAIRGRWYVIYGTVLSVLSVAALLVPYGGLLTLIPAGLLVYGYYEIQGAFDEVLAQPITPRPGARPLESLLV